MTTSINTNFNTISLILENKSKSHGAEMLAACTLFFNQANAFIDNDNYVSKMSAYEVQSKCYEAQYAKCEYTLYVAANAAEQWLCKAWNNAD